MEKKFAIFDMDGTVIDSMPYWRHLTIELLNSKGIFDIENEVLETIKTMSLIEIATYLVNKYKFQIDPKDLKQEMRDLMQVHYENDVNEKKYIRDYLQNLKEKGVKMCIASATPVYLIEIALKKTRLRDYFDFVISCETVNAGKSKPLVYEESAKRLAPGVKYSDIAIFEDSYYASQTAKKAGFYVVGVYDYCARYTWNQLLDIANEHMCFDEGVIL